MQTQDAEIQAIIERNKRVEADKAWEISWFRRILIALFIYIVAYLFLSLSAEKSTQVYLSAFVPAIGYLLSTMTIGPIKEWWKKKVYSRGSTEE